MLLRVLMFILGITLFGVGIYIRWSPVGRITEAISGIVLAVLGVLVCTTTALTKHDRSAV